MGLTKMQSKKYEIKMFITVCPKVVTLFMQWHYIKSVNTSWTYCK